MCLFGHDIQTFVHSIDERVYILCEIIRIYRIPGRGFRIYIELAFIIGTCRRAITTVHKI